MSIELLIEKVMDEFMKIVRYGSIIQIVFILMLFGCKEEDDTGLAPTVEILNPQPNTVISESFVVEVNATVNNGIKNVELYIDNILIGNAINEPYKFSVNTNGYLVGTYTLKVIAYSSSEKYTSKEIPITIVKATMEKPLEFEASKGTWATAIQLTWKSVPGAEGYQVFRLNTDSNKYVNIASVTASAFLDEEVALLAQYFYKVRAFNNETQYGEFSEYDYGYSNGNPYDLITSFGEEGTAEDRLGFIIHISYDGNDLFLADSYNTRVMRYDKQGNFLGEFTHAGAQVGEPKAPLFLNDGISWNVYGSNIFVMKGSNNTINTIVVDQSIQQLAIDDEGFILGSGYDKIFKFDQTGKLISESVVGDEDFKCMGIAFYNGHVVVSSREGNKIRFYTKDFQFVKQWDFNDAGGVYDLYVRDNFLYLACGGYVAKTDFEGTIIEKIQGAFGLASSVVVDETQNIIITSPYQRKIYIYKKSN